MKNKEVINVIDDKCNKCFKCIAACPIKSCMTATGDAVVIDHDKCIACGACINVCDHGARTIKDDFDEFKELTKRRRPFVAIVAPAVVAVFGEDYLRLNGYLKSLGAKAVFDVSFGAELATMSYIDYIKTKNPKTVITQPCPSLVGYIEHYQPSLLKYLAPVHSPMMCSIKYIQDKFPEYRNDQIVVLSPCAAKRLEFNDTFPDALNVTFKSLKEYFDKESTGLYMHTAVEYDGSSAERAVLFSTPGGLKATVERTLPHLSSKIRKIEGKDAVYDYLENLEHSIDNGHAPLIVDCLNCEKGCNGGPGTGNSNKPIDEIEATIDARAEKLKSNTSRRKIEKLVKKEWTGLDLNRGYRNKYTTCAMPSEKEMVAIYQSLDKFNDEDMYNCSACGYNSCEKMARAIHCGLNKKENCYHYQISEMDKVRERNIVSAGLVEEEISKSDDIVARVKAKMGDLEAFVSDQVSAIEESSAAIEQMMASIRSIADNSNSKKSVLAGMMQDFKAVTEAINNMGISIDNVDESVKSVDVMNKVIADIANRTNLLAMNAAIEAAHAGESGKGFAVVADEVRKLAEASKTSVEQIKTTVGGITSNIAITQHNGVDTKNTVSSMGSIINDVHNTFNEITDGISEISVGSDQISEALNLLGESSRKINTIKDEFASVMEEMVNMSRETGELLDAITTEHIS